MTTKEMINLLVRFLITVVSWFTILYMWVNDMEVPTLLQWVATAIVVDLFGEQAIPAVYSGAKKAIKEIKGGWRA